MTQLGKILSHSIYILLACLLAACASNPVTKQTEFSLVSEKQEIRMGESHYPQAQQMSKGLYRQDPQLTAYVRDVGKRLAAVSDRPNLPFEFVVLNDSIPNAWALPGGKIAINRGLLVHLNSEAELAAVLGHEITHATARHGAKTMERQMAMAAGLGTLGVLLSIKMDDPDLANLSMLGAGATLAMVSMKYGRDAELEADHYGITYMVRAGYDPMAAVELQRTFVKLKNSKSPNWLEGLFASHPPSEQRSKDNFEFAKTFPQKNLQIYRDIYQQKTAKLRKQQKSYDLYDKAIKAYSQKQFATASKLVDEAIQQLPQEALFHGLKGDILASQKSYPLALRAYNEAIKFDNQYFDYYLSRGMVYKKLGRYQNARQDIQRSAQLLPSEIAQRELESL